MKSTFELISGMGFNSRITVNLTDRVLYDMDYGTFEDTLKLVKTIGINQLSFRGLQFPIMLLIHQKVLKHKSGLRTM